MRLFLKLRAKTSDNISFNYNYSLSAAIYKLLNFGSAEFSTFLHDIGYESNNKYYKFFTFALQLEKTTFNKKYLVLDSPNANLYISSPLVDDFIKNFVIGTFEKQTIEIYAEGIKTKFNIITTEILPEPIYSDEMYFKMITPMVLSTQVNYNDKLSTYYFRVDDDLKKLNKIFNQNLINKYEAIHNKKYEGKGTELTWDYDYLVKAAKSNKKLTKKVSIMKDYESPIEVVGMFCPFSLKGDIKLIKVGYESGFGSQNSMGFGLVYVDNKKHFNNVSKIDKEIKTK